MTFLTRLLGLEADPREKLRPLWHRVVEISRSPRWYEAGGVADTVPGRFDMIATVLALVLLRLERDPELAPVSHHLTELFVEDMDGQLRELGVGDLMVGKHIGKLMSALGGRLGAFRDASAEGGESLARAAERNITLVEGADPAVLAAMLDELHLRLADTDAKGLLEGRIAR